MARKAVLLVMMLCTLLALGGGVAAAATSPAGIVDDESGTFAAAQLSALDQALTGLKYPFRVIVVSTAFPGGRPGDAEAQFQSYAHKLLFERVPKDAVLITVSLEDRLVDFRVYEDGPVYQDVQAKTGRAFADFSGAILDAYRGPARAGDVPGGIIAAARYIDGIAAVAPAPAPAPAPVTPSPTPMPMPSPVPVPVTPMPAPAPVAYEPGNPWPWFGGVFLLTVAGFWTFYFWRYRKALRTALDTRDAFLGELLELMERELPLARKYAGEETQSAVTATSEAADAALQTEQAGEELRLKAERLARFSRFAGAAARMAEAVEQYKAADAKFREAVAAWQPVSDALRTWEEQQAAAGARVAAGSAALSAEKVRTGWPLTDLGARLEREQARLDLARSSRDTDPVKAQRLARETDAAAEVLAADLGALPGLQQALAEQQKRRLDATALVDEAARTLGLRFVEVSPHEPLARAGTAEEEAGAALPPGEVARVREALTAAHAASDEAVAIVERYKEALRQYPLKSAALNQELVALPGEEQEAAGTLSGLVARYAAEDWEDVRTVADDLDRFQADTRGTLDEVTRITSPAVQLYLKAVDLLDERLNLRESLRRAQGVLAARPAELDALAGDARQSLNALVSDLNEAEAEASRDRLVLPSNVAGQLDDVRRRAVLLEEQGREVPLPVHRWARAAADGAALAENTRSAVAEVARLAAAARAQLARAQAEAGSAMSFERYDHRGSAGTLRGALTAAELAIASGHYQSALAEADRALESCRALEAAYRAYVAAQEAEERRRREAAEAARRASEAASQSSSSSSSSGGGGSWSSGSNNNSGSSGGGGSW